MRSVEGDLGSIGITELFRSIAEGSRSGCLTITHASDEARFFFRRGEVYQAKILGSGVRLGARLVSAGTMSSHDLEEALTVQRSEGGKRRLADVLVAQGTITVEQVRELVTHQIGDMVFELMKWESGLFVFDDGVASDDDLGILLTIEALVLEGAKRFREWYPISRRIPTIDAVAFVDAGQSPQQMDFTAEEWAMLSRINGTKTVVDLAYDCGFTDLEASRTLFRLLEREVATVKLPEGIEPLPEDPELRQAFDELELALVEASSHAIDHELEVIDAIDLPGIEDLPEISAEQRLESSPATESPEAVVVSEEPHGDVETEVNVAKVTGSSYNVSRMFAEISQQSPVEDTDDPHDRDHESDKEPTEADETPKPVDPSVDTGALLREFSGLGFGTEEGKADS